MPWLTNTEQNNQYAFFLRFKGSRVHKSSFPWFSEDLICLTVVFMTANPPTEVTVVYQNGLPVISVSLPSRRERCQFTLKPLSDCVGVFLQQLQAEDRGIDRVAIYSTGTFTSTRILYTHRHDIHLPQQVTHMHSLTCIHVFLYLDTVECGNSCGFASKFNTTACTMKLFHSAQRVHYTETTVTWNLTLSV